MTLKNQRDKREGKTHIARLLASGISKDPEVNVFSVELQSKRLHDERKYKKTKHAKKKSAIVEG